MILITVIDIIILINYFNKKGQDMDKKEIEQKKFQVRIPKDMWLFLRKTSTENEISMNAIINNCIDKYRKDIKSILTSK